MNIKIPFASALALAFFLIACDKDPVVVPNPNQINFQAPVIGQENYYLKFSGVCGQLLPTGDTLILRVKDFNGSDIEFEEALTEGSPSYYGITFAYPGKWSEEILDIKPEYRQSSALFFFYGSDSLRLKQSASDVMHQNDCIVWNGQSDFTGDAIGTVPTFKVAHLEYQSKKIVSCVPTILNLDAYLLYDKNNIYSSFTSSIGGWEPIEDPFVNAYALIEIE
ncbi:MAG TPA: hypothetical protein VMZ69_11570 [Saprospiraceae bacterium]|nr:hypothetical protein [Saprospiraceae bacterium]